MTTTTGESLPLHEGQRPHFSDFLESTIVGLHDFADNILSSCRIPASYGGAKALRTLLSDALTAIEGLQQRYTDASHGVHRVTIESLNKIQGKLDALENKQSYAEVAAVPARVSTTTTTTTNTKTQPTPPARATPREMATKRNARDQQRLASRRYRELVIRVTDSTESAHARTVPTKTVKTLLERRCDLFREQGSRILGVYRHPSSDLSVLLETEEGKAKVEALSTDWTQAIAPSAIVVRRPIRVLAHGVYLKAVDTRDQEKAIRQLTEENKVLHPGLRILAAAWPKSARSSTKARSALILELDSVSSANRLIDAGLIVGLVHHICEPFYRSLRLTQCYNCQGYGHVANQCKKPPTCGHCAGRHKTDACLSKANRRCAACSSPGHKAWSQQCPQRQLQVDRIRSLRDLMPLRYPESGDVRASQLPPPQQPPPPTTTTVTSGAPSTPPPAPKKARALPVRAGPSGKGKAEKEKERKGKGKEKVVVVESTDEEGGEIRVKA